MNFEKLRQHPKLPQHLAFIIDGNGRWAKRRGLPRSMGHKAGMDMLKKQIEYVRDLGIKNLSVYCFSTENWNRPQKEVDYLIKNLFENMIDEFKQKYLDEDVRIIFSGDLDDKRIPAKVSAGAHELMEKTKHKTGFVLNPCINYGGRQEILRATNALIKAGKMVDEQQFSRALYTAEMLPLDLVIRTSGEMRTSNFMPWQAAYSELYFDKTPWPSFNKKHLIKALNNYIKRDRRFGAIKE